MALEEYLRDNNVWYRSIRKPETIHTSDAAKVSGIELKRITKNLVSMTDSGLYVLLVVPGDTRVDLKRVAQALGVKEVRLVPFDQAEKISGYPPGGTPSLGHKTKMKTVLDRSLLQYETIFCGGGSRDRLLELRMEDIMRLGNAIVADITQMA